MAGWGESEGVQRAERQQLPGFTRGGLAGVREGEFVQTTLTRPLVPTSHLRDATVRGTRSNSAPQAATPVSFSSFHSFANA
eukprot:2919043-Rhodomonas_salina.1